MAGRTLEDRFLARLSELSGDDGKVVSNKNLCESLGWSEATYNKVWTNLTEAKKVIKAKAGPGGGLRPAALQLPPSLKPIRAFVSYSHADEAMKTELMKHLRPLERLDLITSWSDSQLKPGENWNKEIADRLSQSELVILLVSVDFLNSAYCYDKELKTALDRQAAGEAVVIPVIARNCLWRTLPIGDIHALPRGVKAISTWDDRDEALTDVAEGVRLVAEELRQRSA